MVAPLHLGNTQHSTSGWQIFNLLAGDSIDCFSNISRTGVLAQKLPLFGLWELQSPILLYRSAFYQNGCQSVETKSPYLEGFRSWLVSPVLWQAWLSSSASDKFIFSFHLYKWVWVCTSSTAQCTYRMGLFAKNDTSNKSVEHTQTPKFSLLADCLQGPRPVSWLRNTRLPNHLFMYTDWGRKH